MKLKLLKSLLILFIVALVFTSSACEAPYEHYEYEELPQTSENFDQAFVGSFFENYHYLDRHLAYYTASPWEIKIEEMDESVTHRREGNYYLSVIDGIDKNHFVSVTAHEIKLLYPGGGNLFETQIYQHINAPKPLKDWTIDSISLFASPHLYLDPISSYGNESAKLITESSYMEKVLNESELLATFEADDFSNNFEALKTAYENQSVRANEVEVNILDNGGVPNEDNYVILLHFKECDNLVWVTYLCESKTEPGILYFDNTFIQIREDRASHEDFYETIFAYVPIDGELSAKLLEVIKQDMES